MRMAVNLSFCLILGAGTLALAACEPEDEHGSSDPGEAVDESGYLRASEGELEPPPDDLQLLDPVETKHRISNTSPGFFSPAIYEYPEFVVLQNDKGGLCSGVLLDASVVLSAHHCTDGAQWVRVTREGIGQHYVDYWASWVGVGGDLWIGHLTEPIWVGIQPEIEPEIWVGDTVTYLGRKYGDTITNTGHGIRTRTVSQLLSENNLVRTNWRVLHKGDSGGPVFLDYSHRLVGVNSSIYGDVETPGSFDQFTRISASVARGIQSVAWDWGGPAVAVRIHWGRQYPF